MHSASPAIVAAVRACVGTRFRLQGRTAGVGLDCVGVALIAAQAAGIGVAVPAYSLGGDHEARLEHFLCQLDGKFVVAAEAGDLLVLAPAAGRRHLAVVVPGGIVHAHAGLGRVVEGPLDAMWTIVAAWRFPERI